VPLKTIADPAVLQSLRERLTRLRPDSRRRWGTLTPDEMLCHLGDAAEMVLRTRPRTRPVRERRRPIFKAVFLWSPIRWPHGIRTSPRQDPRAEGTRPTDFAADLRRAVSTLEAIAAATPDTLERGHGIFGLMSFSDWQRWAYKHTDHHLRQFNL
jgi:hypothetical protein